MNLDQPCANCYAGRGRHQGDTYQGSCPSDAIDALHGAGAYVPYTSRCWRPAPRRLPGGGPWAISPTCPSRRQHNSSHAAKGSSVAERCDCPRAQVLRAEYLEELKNKRAIAAIAAGRVPASRLPKREPVDSSPVFEPRSPEPTSVRPPNFLGAACQQPEVAEIVERSFSLYGGAGGIERREEMRKKVCGTCPLIRECAEWVLAAEKPAGSWGGMYGGMDVWNRDGRELYVGIDAVQEREFSPLDYLASL